jgi:hypothetical protein
VRKKHNKGIPDNAAKTKATDAAIAVPPNDCSLQMTRKNMQNRHKKLKGLE